MSALRQIMILSCLIDGNKKVGKILGYILYKDKIYKYRVPRENSTQEVIIDDGYCFKAVPRQECRIFTDAYIMAKYRSEWYVLSDKLNISDGKITLRGENQNGFDFLFIDGGFPIYQTQINFPDDLSDIIIIVIEQDGRKRSAFRIPIDIPNWNSSDLVCEILEMVFIQEICPATDIPVNNYH